MRTRGRREINRLCGAKLYELEIIVCAEEKALGVSDQLSQALARCSAKTTRDYRDLSEISKAYTRATGAKPHSERVEDILREIIDIKRDWLSAAQSCAHQMPEAEKEILIRICESEQEEIYNLKRCLS